MRVHAFVLGPFATNAYVLSSERTRDAAVVDVGFDPQIVTELVAREGLRVRYLLNTHAHYDHVAAMRDLQEATGASYWLHPADRFLLEALDVQAATYSLPPARAPEQVSDLADGQVLTLGDEEIGVLHTPGHSPGSVTFRSGKLLWAGDLLFAGSVGRTDLPGGSLEALVHSVRHRLFPLGDDLIVLPGHGPRTTIGDERRGNPFVGDGLALA